MMVFNIQRWFLTEFYYFAEETLDHGAGGNFMDFHPLDHSDSSSDRSSNSGEVKIKVRNDNSLKKKIFNLFLIMLVYQ